MTPEQLYEELTLTKVVNKDGNINWYNSKKQLHRIYGPAVERTNGNKFWYQNGRLHREDGPACEYADGIKYWYKNGKYIKHENDIW